MIGDVDLHPRARLRDRDRDISGAMTESIVDQVAQCLLRDPGEKAPSVDLLALHGQRAPLDASQHKQIVGQPRQATGLGKRAAQRLCGLIESRRRPGRTCGAWRMRSTSSARTS
jgi:hypothetical protein